MRSHNFFSIVFFSVVGSILTTLSWAFMATDFELILLITPATAVAQIALTVGFILGLLMSPLMYWCLKDKNLYVILPTIYILIIVAVFLLYFTPAFVPGKMVLYTPFAYWVAILLIMKYYGPARNNKPSEIKPDV